MSAKSLVKTQDEYLRSGFFQTEQRWNFSHSPGDSGAWGACLLGSGEGTSDSITR